MATDTVATLSPFWGKGTSEKARTSFGQSLEYPDLFQSCGKKKKAASISEMDLSRSWQRKKRGKRNNSHSPLLLLRNKGQRGAEKSPESRCQGHRATTQGQAPLVTRASEQAGTNPRVSGSWLGLLEPDHSLGLSSASQRACERRSCLGSGITGCL